jgi:hypothetical protein
MLSATIIRKKKMFRKSLFALFVLESKTCRINIPMDAKISENAPTNFVVNLSAIPLVQCIAICSGSAL